MTQAILDLLSSGKSFNLLSTVTKYLSLKQNKNTFICFCHVHLRWLLKAEASCINQSQPPTVQDSWAASLCSAAARGAVTASFVSPLSCPLAKERRPHTQATLFCLVCSRHSDLTIVAAREGGGACEYSRQRRPRLAHPSPVVLYSHVERTFTRTQDFLV